MSDFKSTSLGLLFAGIIILGLGLSKAAEAKFIDKDLSSFSAVEQENNHIKKSRESTKTPKRSLSSMISDENLRSPVSLQPSWSLIDDKNNNLENKIFHEEMKRIYLEDYRPPSVIGPNIPGSKWKNIYFQDFQH